MAAGPTIDEIMAAVNESGYLMEQEVATSFEEFGYHVRTNVAFEDADEGKSRETDVVAIKRVAHNKEEKLSAFIEIIAECKNSSNPFVFIARPKNSYDTKRVPEQISFPYKYSSSSNADDDGRLYYKSLPAFYHLGFNHVHSAHKAAWKAVQFCRVDRKGSGWSANHGGLYDAMFYPMAKAIKVRQKEIPRIDRNNGHGYFWFLFPIIVTSGDMFLIDAVSSEPEPKPVDQVTFQRELKSGSLSGVFEITFVRQQALAGFLKSSVDPMIERVRELVTDEAEFVKNTKIPWVD